ncbi:MAG: porin [Burkholderiales bacterium]|nr:porin [Burkholderiales bacterium]MCZ2135061.1 porin [Burkholderiales bacterium]
MNRNVRSIRAPRAVAAFAVLPLVLAMASATAQNANVTLYGIVDVGVQYVSGLKGGSYTGLASGIMEGSRWGLRGTEDLGNGYKAMFVLENRFEADTGGMSSRPLSGNQLPARLTAGLPPAVAAALGSAVGAQLGVNLPGRLFDRQAFAGLVTPFGAILAGRQYTPAFEITNRYDAFANMSAASPGQLLSIPAGVDIRESNSVMYRIELNGFYGSGYYAFGEQVGSAKAGRLVGINGGYQSAKWGAGIGYNERTNSAGQKSLNTLAGGANFDFGLANVFALYAQIKEPNGASAPELRAGLIAGGVPSVLVDTGILPRFLQDARLYHVGARVPLGVGTLTVGYSHVDDRRATNADVSSYGAAYTYPLSKRTDLNLAVTQVDNNPNAQVLPGGNGFLGGVTAHGGKNATSIQFSLRHKF